MSDLIVEPKTLRQYAGTRSQAPMRVALRQAADEIERLLSSRAKDVAGITGVLEGLGRHAVSLMEENERLRAALKPFSDLAKVVLAEAPPDAGYISLFVDSHGRSHRITLDQMRALNQQPSDSAK